MSKKRFQLKAQKRFRHEKKFRKIYSWSFQSKSSTASDISSLYTIRHTCARTHTGCQAALDFLFQIAFRLLAMRFQVFSDSLHGRCAFKAAALNWLTLSAC